MAFSSNIGLFTGQLSHRHQHVHFKDMFTIIHLLTLCAHKPIIPGSGVTLIILVFVWEAYCLFVFTYLAGGGRDHFPCHTALILSLNHLAVSLLSPQNHTASAPVPGIQEG